MASAAEALLAEGAAASRGLVRLTLFDARWTDGFDPSAAGFLRSFIAPLLALPLYLPAAAALHEKLEATSSDANFLAAAALSHLINAVGFPILIAVLAKPLGFQSGYSGFVVVINWASLLLNGLLAIAALAVYLGPSGIELFKFGALVIFALQVFIVWRAARETLTAEVAPALLVVVLSVAISTVSDLGGLWLMDQLPVA